jgi:tetratricopeptide (TPR) repeat protein
MSAEEKEIKSTEKEMDKLLKRAKRSADREDYQKAVVLYQEMARLASSIRDRRAVDFCLDAVKYSLKTGDNFKTGWCYKCAAVYSMKLEDFNNAINFAMKAIEYFSKANSMYAVQWCYNIAGEACERLNDHELAIKNYRKSLEIEHSGEIDRKVRNLLKTKKKE